MDKITYEEFKSLLASFRSDKTRSNTDKLKYGIWLLSSVNAGSETDRAIGYLTGVFNIRF